ncbi:glycosyltransferase [Patescibacteria group bacterium]|nr:glycosyltransferase [Patescibacteria group bacterium]
MGNNTKVISVITATYNYGRFLPDCLRSVRNVIMAPLDDWEVEHIVVDDGSTDGTDKLFGKNTDVKYFRFEDNQGVSAARNFGIAQARGEYIFVLDADDVLLQRSLCYLLMECLNRSKNRWAYGGILYVDEKLSYLMDKDYYGWEFESARTMLQSVINGEHYFQHNVLFERSLFEHVGGYDEQIKLGEDVDLFIRFLLAEEKPCYVPIISYMYRRHGKNATAYYGSREHLQTIDNLKEKYKLELSAINLE